MKMKRTLAVWALALPCLLPLAARAQVNYAISGNAAYVTTSYGATGNIVIASNYESRTPDKASRKMSVFFVRCPSDREVQTQSGTWKEGLGLIEMVAERGDGSRAMR